MVVVAAAWSGDRVRLFRLFPSRPILQHIEEAEKGEKGIRSAGGGMEGLQQVAGRAV